MLFYCRGRIDHTLIQILTVICIIRDLCNIEEMNLMKNESRSDVWVSHGSYRLQKSPTVLSTVWSSSFYEVENYCNDNINWMKIQSHDNYMVSVEK